MNSAKSQVASRNKLSLKTAASGTNRRETNSRNSKLAAKTGGGTIDLKATQIQAFEELKQRLKEKELQKANEKKNSNNLAVDI